MGWFMKLFCAVQKRFTPAWIHGVTVTTMTFAFLMVAPGMTHAQQILLPNQEYTETSTDLSVKSLAGPVRIQRTWTAGQWYLNPAWANLRLIPDPLDGVLAVERAGSIYERTGSQVSSQAGSSGSGATSTNAGRIYRFDADNLLQQTATGWRWYDRLGNSIQYSATGAIQGYTNPYGATVSFARDAQGRMVGIQDPQGRVIYTLDYDNAGRVTRISDIAGNAVSYAWNAQQQLSEVTDSRGHVWRYAYDARSQIVRRTNPLGDSLEVTYASNPGEIPASTGFAGLGSGSSGSNGGSTPAASASTGATKPPTPRNARVASYQDEAGARWTYRIEYNRARQEYNIAIQRPDGSNSERRYNKEGWLLYTSLGGETQFQRIVDSATQHRLIDARGQTTTVQMDSNQQPVRTQYPDGSAETFQYDSNGRKLRHTNPLGNVSTWRYDARGALVQAAEAVGLPEQRSHRYTYDEWGNALTYTLGAGEGQGTDASTDQYSYDSWGNTRRRTDAIGQAWSYTHNTRGDIVTETTPMGHVWKAQYDNRGAKIKIEDPQGHARQFNYNGTGLPTAYADALNQAWQLAYDKAGRLVELTDPLGHTWKRTYDALGRTTQRTSPTGQKVSSRYDATGRLIEVMDPAGNTIRHEYGAPSSALAGLRVATQYPTYRQTYKYNQLGRITQVDQILDATSTLSHYYAWDAMGRQLSATDAAGNPTLYQYDALGRLTGIIDSLNQRTQQTWEAHDTVATVTDAKGNIHRYFYDKAGRRTEERRPGGGTTRYQYDTEGQLSQRTDAGGNTRGYGYDSIGNLTTEEHQLAGVVAGGGAITDQRIAYLYDANGLLASYEQTDGAGRRISAAGYQRDGLGRITQRSLRYGSTISHTLGQSYDADGQLSGQTYPDGSQGRYSYIQGRLSEVQLPNASAIHYHNYQWYKPQRIQYPGAVRTQGFDPLLRVSSIQVQAPTNQNVPMLVSRQYQYDPAGNISRITSDLGQTDYTHDALKRLTQAQPDANLRGLGLPTEQYSYDPVHNRTTSAHQPGQWSYNQDSQLTHYPKRKNGQSYPTQVQYNAQGHTQEESSALGYKRYGYDAAERLTRFEDSPASGAATQASYQYDPFGRRISKTVTQGTANRTTYYLNAENGLMAELDANGQVTRAYGWHPEAASSGLWSTEPLWQADVSPQNLSLAQASTSYHFVHTDHLATPMVTTDKTGGQTWKAIREAFGQEWVDSSSAVTMNLRLPGQYFDMESGEHHNYHRDYRPQLGRYLQADPIGILGGVNNYVYVGGSPLNGVDSLGLDTYFVTGGGSAIIGGGGEGSFGIYISNSPNDIGFIVSGGAGGGANVGLSAQAGYVPGALSNASGNTINYNGSAGLGSFTWMTNPETGGFGGASVGPAGRLGGSLTTSRTETWGLRGLLDKIFDKMLPSELPPSKVCP